MDDDSLRFSYLEENSDNYSEDDIVADAFEENEEKSKSPAGNKHVQELKNLLGKPHFTRKATRHKIYPFHSQVLKVSRRNKPAKESESVGQRRGKTQLRLWMNRTTAEAAKSSRLSLPK